MEMPDCISKKMSSTDLEKDIVAMKVKLQMLVFVVLPWPIARWHGVAVIVTSTCRHKREVIMDLEIVSC